MTDSAETGGSRRRGDERRGRGARKGKLGGSVPEGGKAAEDPEARLRALELEVQHRTLLVERREQAADRRERAIDRREQAAALLREANENLVLATVTAQTLTEAAEQAKEGMAHAAAHDFLTGLPNRAALSARLDAALARARKHGQRVGVLFLDLDHFKEVNDALGHQTGDLLLQAVAARLTAAVRASDVVTRLGGDEFVVLLGEVESVTDVDQIADNLLAELADPFVIEGHRLQVSASIGSALSPDDGADVHTLLRNADMAMFQAKRGGRKGRRRFVPK